ncbi:MAG: C-GCAxxG-C-C family protein [Ruminococcus sp.]|nr:C-GCAxxG-C-C family protein [Ruminococcus sp.]
MIDYESSEKGKRAYELFLQGYNCSQAVVGAWADEIGLDFDTAIKLSAGFGGGMGRMREVCGTVSGAFIVLSAKYSSGKPDPQSKKEMYEIIQRFAARFKEENEFDSIICREMLGLKGASEPTPAARDAQYYKKHPCPKLAGLSAALLEEFMYEQA